MKVWGPEFRCSVLTQQNRPCSASVCLCWRGENWHIPGARWSANRAKSISSGLTERPCLKKVSLRTIKGDAQNWPLTSTHSHAHTITHTTRKPASHLHSLESFSTNYTAVRPSVLWRPFHNFGIELTTTVLVLKVMAFPTTNRLFNFPAQSVENGGSIKVLIQEVLVTSGLQQLPKDLQGLTHQNSSRRTHRRYNWECFGAWWATCSKSCYIQIRSTKDHTESSPQRSLKSGGLFCKYDKLYHRREGENI